MKPQALYFTAPHELALRDETLPEPAPGQMLVQTLISAISSGTELLIYRGQVSPDLVKDEYLPALSGKFTFPLKYGYATVGRIIELGPGMAPDLEGKLVFAFHPHESHFLATPDELLLLPEDVTPEDAVFFPNMETAVTFLLDGQPLVGEQVAVFGQGIVGLLLTALLAGYPLASLVTLDLHPLRRRTSESLGATASLDPKSKDSLRQLLMELQGPRPFPAADLAFELSGNPEALDQAIAATGFSGRIVVGSWYGRKRTDLHLGGRFHRSRIRLISSQVSTIAPEFTGRWNRLRRYQLTWQMLKQVKPARFISHRFPLSQAAKAYDLIDKNQAEVLQVILTY